VNVAYLHAIAHLSKDAAQEANEGRELEDGRNQKESTSLDAGKGEEDKYSDEDAGAWYLGKAKADYHKKRKDQTLPDQQRLEEEDLVEVGNSP